MSGFTDTQLVELRSKLDGSVVKQREQSGRKFSYIEGWHAIAEANRIFGFDGWDRETVDLKCVSEKPRKIGKGQYERDGFGVGYVAKVRVTVRANGSAVVREGTGFGSGIDADLGAAHESAIKEAETDAMKRALMTFGNPFGLALYDKDQENVERAAPPKAAPNPAPAKLVPADDLKSQAEALVKKLKAADNLFALDTAMEDGRDLCKKLPQQTYDYIGKLYDQRRTAMERAA